MKVFDYNGAGLWAAAVVIERYLDYAHRLGVEPRRDLTPYAHEEEGRRWVYPVMDGVIEGIEAGDLACIEIGVEFIEESAGLPFGRGLKSNTARALRRAPLTEVQIARVRRRVIGMLIAGQTPREFRQYAKLLRKVGVGDEWIGIGERIDRGNPYVVRYYEYLGAGRS